MIGFHSDKRSLLYVLTQKEALCMQPLKLLSRPMKLVCMCVCVRVCDQERGALHAASDALIKAHDAGVYVCVYVCVCVCIYVIKKEALCMQPPTL